MIRGLFCVTLVGLLIRVLIGIQYGQAPPELSVFLSMPTALFFGLLFLHINNESENTSLLVFAITWVSIVIALYI